MKKPGIITQFINASSTDSLGNETFTTLNPATNEVLGVVAQASKSDIESAISNSQVAFSQWRKKTGAERGRVLTQAAHLLRSRTQELAQLEMQDVGKPISETLSVDVGSAADVLEYFGGLAAGIHGNVFDLKNAFGYTRREPLGVCVGIGAWNYPLQIAAWKAAPALACGNSMIFKPSELTPLTAIRLAEILSEAGAPPGLFNVLQGDGKVGSALVQDPRVAKVSLTGSVPTGKKVLNASGLKPVTLELGGKSPLVVFEDADLNNAVSAALLANFYTQGEVCSNGTRVFVHRKILDEFLNAILERTNKIKVGDPSDPETHMGALISPAHLEKVSSFIKLGMTEGAKLLTGGKRLEVDYKKRNISSGNFVSPAIFAECKDAMSICRDEIFGPVMSILSFDAEDEVVERANNSTFGLAAAVFTRDIQRAHRVVHHLEAGTCWINNYNITPVELPFGGYKQSGIGRENSFSAIHHYTQVKSVYVELGNVDAPF